MTTHGGRRPNAGRKKGSENRATVTWREFGKTLLSHGTARAIEIMDNESDQEFMNHFLQLIKYFRSPPRSSEETPEEYW